MVENWHNFTTLSSPSWLIWPAILVPLLTWSLIWKGLALWRAARKNEPYWFLALLLINTLGILEILYLYIISPNTKPNHRSSKHS